MHLFNLHYAEIIIISHINIKCIIYIYIKCDPLKSNLIDYYLMNQ